MTESVNDEPLAVVIGHVFARLRESFDPSQWHGLRQSHFRVLEAIDQGADRTTDLAATLQMTKQGAGQLVTGLVDAALVVTGPDPADRRVRRLTLTPAGAEVAVRLRRHLDAVEREWADRVGAQDYATMRRVLAAIAGSVPTIHVVAACTTDADGRFLLVRKRGSENFMQPGGKPEPGESAVDALVRELAEELLLTVATDDLAPWGRFEADAANEPGHALVADVFGLRLDGEVTAAAEIAEARWFTRAEALALGDRLAPLARRMLDAAHGRTHFRPFRFTEPIRTERLRLRLFTPDDVDAVHAYLGREDATRYLLWDVRTRTQVEQILATWAAGDAITDEKGFLEPAVERLDTGEVIGHVYLGLSSIENLTAEIGWTLHPDHHGHGYATEAAREMLRLAFEDLGLHRVVAEYDPRNPASIAVAERLGMRHEAHLRQDLWFKGDWADTGVHAILADEWRT